MTPIFTRSNQTSKIIDLFKSIPIDASISFQDASHRLGFMFDAKSGAYHSARRIATKEHGVVIEGIRCFGFKRLTGEDTVNKRSNVHDGVIRRRARRAAREITAAITQNLRRDTMILATEKLGRYQIIADLSMGSKAASNKRATETPPVVQTDTRQQVMEMTG